MGWGHVFVPVLGILVILPADFIRSKIRSLLLKWTMGHINANGDHHHVRLSSLIITMSMVCSNFTCKANAQKQNSKTLDSGMALWLTKTKLNDAPKIRANHGHGCD